MTATNITVNEFLTTNEKNFDHWLSYCKENNFPVRQCLHRPPAEMKNFLRTCTKNDDQYWFIFPGAKDKAHNYIMAMRIHLTRLRQKVRDDHGMQPQQFKVLQLAMEQGKDVNDRPVTIIGLVRTKRPDAKIRRIIDDPVADFLHSIAVTEESR